MAIIASDDITLVDVTDAYAVNMTSDAHTFPGSINAALAGSTSTQISAFRGKEQVPCSVVLSEITKPSGVTVTSNNDATSPTLTISVATTVTAAGIVKIPVHIGDITIHKEFSFSIAFKGATGAKGDKGDTGNGIKTTTVTYQKSSSGTTIPTGTWGTTIPSVGAGEYLWTKTTLTYTDNTTEDSYSVGMMGATGAKGDTGAEGKGVKSTSITYQKGTSGTAQPTGNWSNTIPAVGASEYLWTKTEITYTDNTKSTSYSVGMMGATGAKGDKGDTGAKGADAIVLVASSSRGLIFKNSAIETVLTAHVFRAGQELSAAEIAEIGTIKWYDVETETVYATGATLIIDAGDVDDEVSFRARLES